MPIETSVEIIILSHNYAAFLPEAIESALSQTRPIAVTVVDDGSTDTSAEVAARYLPEIRLVQHENRGVERSFNDAAAASSATFIVRLDADDRIDAHFVEATEAALLEAEGASYAYSDVRRFGARGGTMRAGDFSVVHLLHRNYISATTLLSRSAFLAVGGYLVPTGPSAALEDWDLWLRMSKRGYWGVYVPRPLVEWRRHEAGSRNLEAAEQWPQVLAEFESRFPDLYGRTLFKVLQRKPFDRLVPWLRRRRSRVALRRIDRAVLGIRDASRPASADE